MRSPAAAYAGSAGRSEVRGRQAPAEHLDRDGGFERARRPPSVMPGDGLRGAHGNAGKHRA